MPVEVEVVFSEEGYRLVGTVLLEGEPVPEAHIRLERDGGSFPRGTVTDYRGSFVFEGVAAGAYLLSGVLMTSARLESPRFQIDSDRVVVIRVDQLGNVTLD